MLNLLVGCTASEPFPSKISCCRTMEDFELNYEDDFFRDGTEPEPYLFEPEYTDAELHILDEERAKREEVSAEPVEQLPSTINRRDGDFWCRCGSCQPMPTHAECFCCTEWDSLLPSMQGLEVSNVEDNATRHCFTSKDEFTALINPAVVETFFHVTHLGKNRPIPAGPNGQLSIDQYRLVSYRLVLEWALKGQRLGRHNRKPLPSCVALAIRRHYPSETGCYAGVKEWEASMDIL